MATTSSSTARDGAERPPRRLSRDARRKQLVHAAMPIIAEQGLTEFSLEDVAARAGVTRNLLYHYFPRGRPDLRLAVGERLGHELTDDWITDESIPLPDRMVANARLLFTHALTPTDAWILYRRARAADDPELNEIIGRFVERAIENVSLNQFGTTDPAPLERLALRGYLVFTEAVLDEARVTGAPRENVTGILAETLSAVVRAGRNASRYGA